MLILIVQYPLCFAAKYVSISKRFVRVVVLLPSLRVFYVCVCFFVWRGGEGGGVACKSCKKNAPRCMALPQSCCYSIFTSINSSAVFSFSSTMSRITCLFPKVFLKGKRDRKRVCVMFFFSENADRVRSHESHYTLLFLRHPAFRCILSPDNFKAPSSHRWVVPNHTRTVLI